MEQDTMITDKKTLKEYIKADRTVNFYSRKKVLIEFLSGGGLFSFLKTLRKLEFFINTNHRFLASLKRIKYLRLQRKFNIQIPPNVFESGLRIDHLYSITVNSNARIGKNCTIYQGVTIGDHGKKEGSAQIGNNCFIGANACIIGKVSIGNNVVIGAGSVVTHDIKDNLVVVGLSAQPLNQVKH